MTIEIPLAIWHEMTARTQLPRTPEQELVMNATQTVDDYSNGGEEGGAMYGPYLFNAVQVSARVRPGDLVLDLGCGPGRLLNLIAKWNPLVNFIGVDLAPKMLQAARDQASEMKLKNIEYREADFSSLDGFADHSVDAIISSMALHHLPDRLSLKRCFAAVGRVLRPDGALYLMDFGRLKSKQAVEIFVAKVARTETPALSDDYRASLYASFTPEDFETEISALALPSVSLHRTVIAPLAMVACTPLPNKPFSRDVLTSFKVSLTTLSPLRRAEFQQLKLFLRLGGLEFPG